MPARPAPILVIGIGNPSRGDDALGPLALERLAVLGLPDVELLADFQLQVEHALDLEGRREVIFIDASVAANAPFDFGPVEPAADASATTHALSPAAVLDTYRRVIGVPPPASVLAIRGHAFELGEPLSARAAKHLDLAVAMLAQRLRAQVDRRDPANPIRTDDRAARVAGDAPSSFLQANQP
jgi:hydrogenase maturation protease